MDKISLKDILSLHEKRELVGAFRITNDEYHASPGLSKSALSDLLVSPAYYRYRVQNPVKSSKDMIMGSVYHCLLLKDEPFEDLFYITKTQPMDSKLDDKGREPISEANLELVKNAVEKFEKNLLATAMLDGLREIAFFWTDKETGVLCKCKPDCIISNKGVVMDLKFTRDISQNGFSRDMVERSYHIQAAFYLDGVRQSLEQSGQDLGIKLPDSFIFAAQEKAEPFDIGFYSVGPFSLQMGEEEYKKALSIYAECANKNEWPGITQGKIKEIELPAWYFSRKGFENGGSNGEV